MTSVHVAVLLAFSTLLAGGARAGTIGPNCSSCQGGVYDLTYSSVSSTSTTDTFNLYLKINTSSYSGGGMYIYAVAPKVTSSLVSAILLSAPNSSTWDTGLDSGITSNGCSGSGSGFLCSESTGHGALVSNNINSWSWRVTMDKGSLMLGSGNASLKVNFQDAAGDKIGALVSEPITLTAAPPVPEPGTMALLGLGLIGVYFVGKRRN